VITHTDARELVGAELLDASGDKVGVIGQIYLDGRTGEPGWAIVNTGLLGVKERLVPLAQADRTGHAVRVPYEKSTIKDAPNNPCGDGPPDEVAERQLLVYYGLDFADRRSDSGVASGQAKEPVERVRLTKEAVQAVDRMSEQIRIERIAADADLRRSQRSGNR
jgi:sporulation protein YlmC with PRC-barrel domain